MDINMKITAELYGNKIGVNGNLKDLIEKRECQILVSFKNGDDRVYNQFVLNDAEARDLCYQIQKSYDVASKEGFRVV
jgi:hypothetical protein